MEPPGRQRYSESVKMLLVKMSDRMPTKDVVSATGINRWTIRRARLSWESTGRVVSKSVLQGRPPILSAGDVAVRDFKKIETC